MTNLPSYHEFSFVCETKSARKSLSGPVRVSVKNKYNATSTLQFNYVDPTIGNYSPQKGPVAGATNVTITGQNLDVGNDVRVTIDRQPCEILG